MAILLYQCTAIVLIALLSTPSFYAQKLESNTDKQWFQINGNEVKLQLYNHIRTGEPNMNAYEVSRSSITSTSPSKFGQVFVFDEPLTVERDSDSEEVGRLQGQAFSSDLRTLNMEVYANLYLTKDVLNGSTVMILGRNRTDKEARELAVVGGTGVFRNARGDVTVSRPIYVDPNIPHMIFEYTLNFSV